MVRVPDSSSVDPDTVGGTDGTVRSHPEVAASAAMTTMLTEARTIKIGEFR